MSDSCMVAQVPVSGPHVAEGAVKQPPAHPAWTSYSCIIRRHRSQLHAVLGVLAARIIRITATLPAQMRLKRYDPVAPRKLNCGASSHVT